MPAELIQRLKWGSTWKLVGLALITFGVYTVYYARRQTLIINEFSPPENQLNLNFIRTWFVITYCSLALFVVYFVVPSDSPWTTVSDFSDRIDTLFGLIWAFMARHRLHQILQSVSGTPTWFHGFWTFLFQSLYINFKVNSILEAPVPPTSLPPVPAPPV